MTDAALAFICTKETFRAFKMEGLRWWHVADWQEAYKANKGMWPDLDFWSEEEWDELYSQGCRYCAVLKNARAVAITGLWPRTENKWEVIAVGTAPGYRNRGYGKAIVSFVTKEILESGRSATITTRNENTPMLKIIERLGYRSRSEREQDAPAEG